MDWIVRLEGAPGDEGLQQQFERWLEQSESHRAAYRSVQYTWARLGRLPRDRATREAASHTVVALPSRRPRRVRWLAAGAALAAACLALIAFPVIERHVLADHATGVAELREIVLPDGSVATLDAGSAIALDYRDGARAVSLLSGQAFFQVLPDAGRPFRVQTGELAVLVTGTAFNVNSTPDAISVSVASGSVEVTTPASSEQARLGAGDRVSFDRRARVSSRGQVPLSHVASWRSRRLVVHEASVAEVVAELGRHQSGVIVVYDRSLDAQTVSGVFDLSQPHEALNALAESQGARLTQFTPYLQVISLR